MIITQALENLELHNKWRRGENDTMLNPKNIGASIDCIIDFFRKDTTIKSNWSIESCLKFYPKNENNELILNEENQKEFIKLINKFYDKKTSPTRSR